MYPRTSYRRTPPWVTAVRRRRHRERVARCVFAVAGLALMCAAYVPVVVAALS